MPRALAGPRRYAGGGIPSAAAAPAMDAVQRSVERTSADGAMPGAYAAILTGRGSGVGRLPVGSSGAGAVDAARRAATDVVQRALSNVGLEAEADGRAPRAGDGASAGASATPVTSWHTSDGTHAEPATPSPVQRAASDAEKEPEEPDIAQTQERLSDLLDALETRLLAQIERRGGRYRGMFS
ncbi:MAG: hypothetical protein WD734_06765 [Dehalococcoidia bacterium]